MSMGLLASLPAWARLLVLAAIVAAAVGAYEAWAAHQRDIGRDEGRAEISAAWNAEKQIQLAAALSEAQANAEETLRRMERQRESQHAQDKELAAARRDAAAARQSAAGLRQWADDQAAAARRTSGDSAARVDGQAAADPAGMLADVLRRADERAGILAEYADRARIAGQQCERDYDALIPAE
jgi:hypothetical protein